MRLEDITLATGVARPGMLVRDVFLECVSHHVQALPFCNDADRITGRVTLKNIMKYSCLPEYMVELAHVLGNQLACLDKSEAKIKEVLCNPIEPYVLEPHVSIGPQSPVVKALALMEKHDTSYIFVVDDSRYLGIVTIQGIAEKMAELDSCMPSRSIR